MIFNTETYPVINMEAVAPSKYEVGLEGALMHVYETECNYNALMKAAGLSELRYFKETGGDLFVNEAGAFKGFIAKAKAMFKAVIDKIVAMFKRFFMLISSYVSDDKTFVKKYRNVILRRQDSIKDFEFKGYEFGNIDVKADLKLSVKEPDEKIPDSEEFNKQQHNYTKTKEFRDEHEHIKSGGEEGLQEEIEKNRGGIVDKGRLDEKEFKEELKDKLYGNNGEKTTLENISLSKQLDIISETNENIKIVKKVQDKAIAAINTMIKRLEGYEKYVSNGITDKNAKLSNQRIAWVNYNIKLYKAQSADITVALGMMIQAYKDRNRQAKAICVKAMSYKNKEDGVKKGFEESVSYGVDDIFADVVIQ